MQVATCNLNIIKMYFKNDHINMACNYLLVAFALDGNLFLFTEALFCCMNCPSLGTYFLLNAHNFLFCKKMKLCSNNTKNKKKFKFRGNFQFKIECKSNVCMFVGNITSFNPHILKSPHKFSTQLTLNEINIRKKMKIF